MIIKKATLFGGAINDTTTKEYLETIEIGKLLAEHGYTLYNGGYGGMMEASAKGMTDKGGSWYHPDAIEIDEDYGKGGGVVDGDYIKCKCPNCNKTWWEELPN